MTVFTLNRMLAGVNGTMIRVPIKHFSNKEAAEKAKMEADAAYQEFFSGTLVIQTDRGPRPIMPMMNLLADMQIQGVGHDISEGDVHDSALLVPAQKIFLPNGVQ